MSAFPAQFVVSIDLEMSWGAIHHGSPHDDSPYRGEREVVADVLAAMEKHQIAATWAVVGHLFLDSCSPSSGVKHPEVVRPSYEWLPGDWYDLDPCGNLTSDPTWYGSDLIESIRACATPQEIGSHAFGHLIAGDPGCSRESFASDIAACQSVAAEHGIRLESFVYPRNSVAHLDLLAEAGFSTFRGATPARFAGVPGWRRRALAALDTIRPMAATAVLPSQEAGMVNVPHTYLFDPDSTTAQRYGTAVWSLLVRRRLHHAVRTSSLFHLWFHTHNLSGNPARARAGLDSVFGEARRLIDAGRLENLTMSQVGAQLQASPDAAT